MVDDARIPRNPALSERALARALLADPSALGSPAPERSAERPAARPAGAPRRDRAGALLALVDAVELARYSGSAAPREDLAPHLRALAGAIRPAWWGLLPRSLWRR
jgi:hypothetical protein